MLLRHLRSGWMGTLLKLIGVALFVYILSRIDRAAVWETVREADPLLLALSFALLFVSYVFKTMRWHTLVHAAGLKPTFADSWRLFHIGIFFGNMTPSNVGELGRAAYLRREGLHGATAVSLIVIDRLADVLVIAIIGIASVGVLFGALWTELAAVVAVIGVAIVYVFARKFLMLLRMLPWLHFLLSPRIRSTILSVTLWSIAAWVCYFAWTITLGRALGIELSIPTFTAILTLTGLVALLPIAPAGLGTRDATFLALTAPFAIPAERAVAMSLLMAVFILLSCLPGLFYWMRLPQKKATIVV